MELNKILKRLKHYEVIDDNEYSLTFDYQEILTEDLKWAET